MTFVAFRVCRNISFSYIKEKKTTPSPYITGLVYHEALELLFLSLKKKDFLNLPAASPPPPCLVPYIEEG